MKTLPGFFSKSGDDELGRIVSLQRYTEAIYCKQGPVFEQRSGILTRMSKVEISPLKTRLFVVHEIPQSSDMAQTQGHLQNPTAVRQ